MRFAVAFLQGDIILPGRLALGDRVRRLALRAGMTTVLAAAYGAESWAGEHAPTSDDDVVMRFVTRPDEPTRSFRALRHLEVESPRLGKSAWMDAMTELDPERGFSFTVLGVGGSDWLVKKVLDKMLRTEQEVYASGGSPRAAPTAENYDLRFGGRVEDGRVRLLAKAKRKETGLVNGHFLVTADSADLVQVEGRLAKGPAFWVPRVDLKKTYARIEGHRVVVRVEAISYVRLLGPARFLMTLTYEMIDGQILPPPGAAVSAASGTAR